MQFIIKLKTGSKEFNKSTRFPVSVTASGRVLAVGEGWLSWLQGHAEPGLLCHTPPLAPTPLNWDRARAWRFEADRGEMGIITQTGVNVNHCLLFAPCLLLPLQLLSHPELPWHHIMLARAG